MTTTAMRLSYDEVREWRQATQGTAEIAFSGGGLNIADGPAGAVLITEVKASRNLFAASGCAARRWGVGFLPEEAEGNGSNVVVLDHALWQQSFGGDRNVLGKHLDIGGVSRTVIGVMAPQFAYPLWRGPARGMGAGRSQRIAVGQFGFIFLLYAACEDQAGSA